MLARAVLALSLAVRGDNTGVPPGDRASALAAARDILKDAGIAVTWPDDDTGPHPPTSSSASSRLLRGASRQPASR
jgi:hypothetical protein